MIVALNVAQVVIEATDKTRSAFDSIHRSTSDLQSRFAALSSLLGVGLFAKFMSDSLESADKTGKMAQSVGISTEALSRMSVSAKLSDVDMEQLAKSMGKLSRNVIDAAAGQGTAATAFDFLGIKVRDTSGHLKSNDQIMAEVADKFSNVKDGAGKTALAMDIFGKSGAALIPMLNGGSVALKENAALADKLGLTMKDTTTAAAEAVRDRFTVMGMALQGVSNNVMRGMLPTFDNLSKVMVNTATDTDLLGTASSGLSMMLKSLVTGGIIVKDIFSTMGNVLAGVAASLSVWSDSSMSIKDRMKSIGGVWKDVHSTMVDNASADIGRIAMMWDDAAPKIAAAAGNAGKAGKKSFDDYANAKAKAKGPTSAESELNALGAEAAKFKFLSEHVAEYQDRITSAKAAQIEFENTLGKNKDETPAMKARLLSAARAVDEQAQSVKINLAALATDNKIKKINAETEAIGLNNAEKEIAVQLADLEASGIKRGTDDYTKKAAAIRKAVTENVQGKEADALKKQQQADADDIKRIQLQTALLGENTIQQKLATDALDSDIKLRQKIIGMTAEGAAAEVRAAEETKKARAEAFMAQDKASREWSTGAKTATNEYLRTVTDSAAQSKQLFTDAFKGMEDALVNFVKTGKLDFKSLADNIITDLIRIQVQQSVMPALSGGMSSILGSIGSMLGFGGTPAGASTSTLASFGPTAAAPGTTDFMALAGFKASGGPVDPNSLYRVNELGPEILSTNGNDYLMMGGRGGFVKPLGTPASLGGSAAGSVTVNVINNAGGAQATAQQRPNGNGGMTIDVIVEQIESGIARNVSRGTGALNSAMTQTFGLNRAAGVY